VSKFFKIKVKDQMFEITEDEILTFLKAGTESGVFEEGEEEMLHSIFEFSDTAVKEILTPRRDIFAIEAEKELGLDFITDEQIEELKKYKDDVDFRVGADVLLVEHVVGQGGKLGFVDLVVGLVDDLGHDVYSLRAVLWLRGGARGAGGGRIRVGGAGATADRRGRFGVGR